MSHSAAPPPLREVDGLTVLRFLRDPLESSSAFFDQHGDTVSARFAGRRCFFTRSPEWFETVLVQRAAAFQKDPSTKSLQTLLGNGLLVQDGPLWKARRRLLSSSFVPASVEGHVPIFIEEAERELSSWQDGAPLDAHASMARLTMQVALRAFFGQTLRTDFEKPMALAMRYFEGFLGSQIPLPLWIPTRTNRDFLRARRELRAVLGELLAGSPPDDCALGALKAAERAGNLSSEDVVHEAMTLLVAGHETSALTLTFLLAELGKRAELQSKLQEEVRSLPAQARLRPPSGSLLEATVLETLRLYPVTWMLGREATAAVQIGGTEVPPRALVYLSQWALHRKPDLYPDPCGFDPTRWQGRPLSQMPHGSYTPFGDGPRVCIGQRFATVELSVLLVEVLRRFRLSTVSEFPTAFRASVTARPKTPVVLRPFRVA